MCPPDDDLPPVPPAASPVSDEYRFPCENCGAQLRFSPGQRRLTCEYCGHEQDIPATEAQRDHALEALDLREALADHVPPEAMEEHRARQCLKDMIEPVYVARMAVFLASDDAAMCTAQDFLVEGGTI